MMYVYSPQSHIYCTELHYHSNNLPTLLLQLADTHTWSFLGQLTFAWFSWGEVKDIGSKGKEPELENKMYRSAEGHFSMKYKPSSVRGYKIKTYF